MTKTGFRAGASESRPSRISRPSSYKASFTRASGTARTIRTARISAAIVASRMGSFTFAAAVSNVARGVKTRPSHAHVPWGIEMTRSKPKTVWDKGPNPDRRLQGRAWQKLRARWLQEHPVCVMCGTKSPPRVTLATILDHIRPRSKGGTEVESNLQALCKDCDRIKQALDRGYKPRKRKRVGLDGWAVDD